MLSIKTGSLIKKARLTSDGKLLNQALELERARLRDHGAETGLDKYKAGSIKKLKGCNDYHQYKKDCLAARSKGLMQDWNASTTFRTSTGIITESSRTPTLC